MSVKLGALAALGSAAFGLVALQHRSKKKNVRATESAMDLSPLTTVTENRRITSIEQYNALYQYSLDHGTEFWKELGEKVLEWFTPFTEVSRGDFIHGDVAWFLNGKTNACYNCVDRHARDTPDKVAILWEGDETSDIRRITYTQLLRDVCQFANALKRRGVRKGDAVCIYMPMVPEAAIAMLACARIGAPHSVVFGGFSADSLKDRILDGNCKVLITADEGVRGGRIIPLKNTCDEAIANLPPNFIHTVFVLKRTGNQKVVLSEGRDVCWQTAVEQERAFCPCEPMDSEDCLFMLYTSGSTGKPKGIQHSTAGYLLYATLTHRVVFDLRPSDIYACVADVGWITGHTYIVYGPLSNGATTFMFESTPLYPTSARYWDMVERHKINILYTAPTAIRSLMKFGSDPVKKHDRSTLRVLGSVGEPINPEAWKWYHEVVGDSRCSVVDTFWQTETGGVVLTPLPGVIDPKPGAAMMPFFGIQIALMDQENKRVEGNDKSGFLVMTKTWPGILRSVYGDHQRFLTTYMRPFPGTYLTGDGSTRDSDGHYWITGRVDDVINVSGHRLGSAEIESALVEHPAVVEAAVVGVPHEVKGESLFAYVTCKEGINPTPELIEEMKATVRKHIGGFARPDDVIVAPAVPKTRSGKIMRRLLRKIASGETDLAHLGDVTTLADTTVVSSLIKAVQDHRKPRK